ncbi:MAG TPA: hypothetical protein V6C95_08720, partial [Coleofasciculaceae cyanobacterium]
NINFLSSLVVQAAALKTQPTQVEYARPGKFGFNKKVLLELVILKNCYQEFEPWTTKQFFCKSIAQF